MEDWRGISALTVFNLSRKVLMEMKVDALKKGLGYAPTPTRINEGNLKRNFNEFER